MSPPMAKRGSTFARAIEPLAHFLAGLEERHALLIDGDMRAGARIATGARRALLHRKGAEAAQLDAVAAPHGGDDLAKDGVDDVLNVALVQMWVLFGDALNQFRLDHVRRLVRRFGSPENDGIGSVRTGRVAKSQ